jgi:hypothetical protein
MKHTCKTCGEEIHPKRVALGYKTTCTKHSTAERFSAVVTSEGREGDSNDGIHIIRDAEIAKQLVALSNIYG